MASIASLDLLLLRSLIERQASFFLQGSPLTLPNFFELIHHIYILFHTGVLILSPQLAENSRHVALSCCHLITYYVILLKY